jgi:hypothetical protein
MRYRLRTLMIASALLPPLIAALWFAPGFVLFVCLIPVAIAAYIGLNLAVAYVFACAMSGMFWLIGKLQGK